MSIPSSPRRMRLDDDDIFGTGDDSAAAELGLLPSPPLSQSPSKAAVVLAASSASASLLPSGASPRLSATPALGARDINAIDALNAFGRSPTPPRAPAPADDEEAAMLAEAEAMDEGPAPAPRPSERRLDLQEVGMEEEDDGYDFDPDADLALAEAEEEQPPSDVEEEYVEQGVTRPELVYHIDDDVQVVRASARTASAAAGPSSARLDAHDDRPAQASVAKAVPVPRSAPVAVAQPVRARDPLLGIGGIPKYIPAGTWGATTMDGNTVRFERRKRMRGWHAAPPHYGLGTTGLLAKPAYQVMQAAEALAATAVADNADRAESRKARAVTDVKLSAAAQKQKMGVWVERYRPTRFTELLGEDRVHRDVLSWLKSWDPCVFKRKARKRPRDEPAAQAAAGPSRFGDDSGPMPYYDAWDRPEQRVLLLSGPPGLGKTTLAHVVAATCGYAVHELNASDARTAGAVEDRVRVALESTAIGEVRPTCVVIDEIDGATGGTAEGQGFIKSLVRLIEMGKGNSGGKGKGGRKKKKNRALLRPIICICNDLYAPALRPLRAIARLVRLPKPTTNHLVPRLRAICEKESLATDTRSLTLLAELTSCDVRSCLNALQMARARGPTLVPSMVRDRDGNGLGIKDGSTNTQRVFELLFRTPSPKERARGSAPRDGHEMMARITHQVVSSGEHERLLHGCFEHYPLLRPQDDGWWRYSKMHDWIAWGEQLSDKGWELGTTELMQYSAWSFVPWHFLFANTVNEMPAYPRADYEAKLKRTAFEEVAAELHTAIPTGLRVLFSKESIVTELGPSLMRMLSPDLRPVNSQVTRPDERITLAAVVQIMLGLNLNFVQDRAEEGQLIYRLEPALDAFVQYEGKRSTTVGPARFAVRQMIAREMESAKLRMKVVGADAVDEHGNPLEYKELAARAAAGAIAAYTRSGPQPAAAVPQKAALDFFGRVVVPKLPKEKLKSVEGDAEAIRAAEIEAEKEKAEAARLAPPLPSLLMERRAAKLAASAASNPHIKRQKVAS